MPGEELLPLAAAAAKGVQSAIDEDESVKRQLARMAEDTPEMKQAARAFARRVEIKQKLLLRLYAPLEKLVGTSKAYFEDEFAQDMAERIADVPEEALVAPSPTVAVPAMQALGYSLDEPDLKAMYLNLLATATDARAADQVHPSFPEVVKQLSGKEAKLLSAILQGGRYVAIVRLRVKSPVVGYVRAENHIIDTRDPGGTPTYDPSVAVWVDNWVRLGLVEVDYTSHLTEENSYDWVTTRPEWVNLNSQAEELNRRLDAEGATESHGRHVPEFDTGVLLITDFGRRFAAAVGDVHTRAEP